MKKARVLITRDCNRSCKGCCNSHDTIMKDIISIDNLSQLPKDLDEIMITGGEPMLYPNYTLKIAKDLKNIYQNRAKIFLYTALYSENIVQILPYIDGLHYTIHEEHDQFDIFGLFWIQDIIARFHDKSYRLYIDNNVSSFLNIIPSAWDNIKISKWLTEKELLMKQPYGLPPHEILYDLKRKE